MHPRDPSLREMTFSIYGVRAEQIRTAITICAIR